VANDALTLSIRKAVLRSLIERYRALGATIDELRLDLDVPLSTTHVVDFLHTSVAFLAAYTDGLSRAEELVVLDEVEFDAILEAINNCTEILLSLFGTVSQPDLFGVPVELTEPLKRMVERIFGSGDLLLVPNNAANYQIIDLRASIFTPFALEADRIESFLLPPDLPNRLFCVSVPSAEVDSALIHCILAHEFGHHLFDWERLAPQLGFTEEAPLFSDIADEATRAQAVKRAGLWAKELAADMFGVSIFGPAYLAATIHFAVSIQGIDAASRSHPPLRLRLNWSFRLLDKLYTVEVEHNDGNEKRLVSEFAYGPNTAKLLATWREIADKTRLRIGPSKEINEDYATFLMSVVNKPPVYDAIQEEVHRVAQSKFGRLYSVTDYLKDLLLTRSIAACIPPIERTDAAGTSLSTIEGIMNAAWECYLGEELGGFATRLPVEVRGDAFRRNRTYNDFLLKTLELNEVARTWREWSELNATIVGQNT
jgi:hypothetical protein